MGATSIIRDLPYAELKRAIHFIRRYYFTRGLPNAPGLMLTIEPEDFESTLKRDYHYEEADRYSYHYDDEVVNLRTPFGLDSENKQLENHLRLFNIEHEKWKSYCLVHLERSRFEHWHDHINDIGLSWDDGIEIISNVAREINVETQIMTPHVAYEDYHNGEIPKGVPVDN